MPSSLLPVLQSYLRHHTTPRRQLVRAAQYDEQAGFGEVNPRLSAAVLLETPMRAIAVGECAVAENPFRAFVDGIQRSWLLYYQDWVPVYYGYVAAVVRQRQDRLMSTWEYADREALYVPLAYFDPGEQERLRSLGLTLVDTGADQSLDPEETPLQPAVLRELARNAIGASRQHLEAELAKRWLHRERDGWLVLDGSIAIAEELARHRRAVGLIKSHNTQYFRFPDQEVVLNLPRGQRSAAFEPPGHPPTGSWYLRLHDSNQEDLYFGLLRVETCRDRAANACEISRWILTERRPLSLPDSRWDRMIYPIRDCEQYLRSREPSRVSLGWLG